MTMPSLPDLSDLKHNAALIQAFRSSVVNCNINNVPAMVRRVLETRAWEARFESGRLHQHETFLSFITTKPLSGCGWVPGNVEALIRKSDDVEALAMWRQATTRANHRPGGEESTDIVSTSDGHGNSLAYTLDRLQRLRPDLYAEVVAKRISANAAAKKAGWRKPPSPLKAIQSAWSRATDDERRAIRAWWAEQ